MFELKPLSRDAIAGALAKAERYRLLNEAEKRRASATTCSRWIRRISRR